MSAAAPTADLQFRLLDWTPSPSKPVPLPHPPAVEPVKNVEDVQPEDGQREDVRRLRASLEATIAAKVMNATELIRSVARHRREEVLPTTLTPFDQLLGGGLPRGRMTELAGRHATGRFGIVMAALASATSMGEAAVLVDLDDHFDPQLAVTAGIDLRRLLWVRPTTLKQAVMSVEMIAATGFQLVVLDTGLHPLRGRRVPDASWVRLGRTAEASGAALLISTPYPLTGTASEAVVTARRTKLRWAGGDAAPRLLASATVDLVLDKHRHLRPGLREELVLYAAESPRNRAAERRLIAVKRRYLRDLPETPVAVANQPTTFDPLLMKVAG